MIIETGFTVKYNNLSPWGTGVGCFPPFVSVEIEEDWTSAYQGSIRRVTLNGTIPSGGFTNTINAIKTAFSQNYKAFEAPNIYMPVAYIEEISFDSQKFIGKTDYSITLRDYSGCLNHVLEPIDEITIDETTDGLRNISHRISAKGISTGNISNSLENAKSFVLSRTGISTWSNFYGAYSPILLSTQESINRFEGTYSVLENYKIDILNSTTNNIIKRFSVDMSSGMADDYVRLDVSAYYQIGKTGTISNLKNSVSVSDLYSCASGIYLNSDLNSEPISFSVDLDETGRTLSARASFDNSIYGSYFDYEIESQKDYKTELSVISIKGNIIGSGRHVRKKYEKALEFFNTTVGGFDGVASYLYPIATGGLVTIANSNFALNPNAKNLSATFNSGMGIISINCSFDDAPYVSGYNEYSWSVSTDCGINIFKPFASANVNGSYLIQDFNIINRTNINMNGSFEVIKDYPSQTSHLNILSLLKNEEGTQNGFVESENYTKSSGESMKSGFTYSYSKEGCDIVGLPEDKKIYSGTRI